MDGTLPPLAPALAPTAPGGFAPAPRPQAPGYANPVGRPSGDPEQQAARAERSAEAKRIEAVLPKAVDSKCLVYRSRDGKTASGKALLTILVKDLEEANNGGTSTDDYIAGMLQDKEPNGGLYVARFVDRAGKSTGHPPWEIDMRPEGEEDDLDDDDDTLSGFQESLNPAFAQPPGPGYPVAPPAPPVMDTQSFTTAIRNERQDEQRRGNEFAAMMAQQQQTTTQMMLQMQQQQRESDERSRRDAADRDERESKRRSEFRQTLLAILPLALPLVEKFFKKEAPAADPAASVMLEIVKAKLTEKPDRGTEAVMMETMVKTMGEMSKQQMASMQQGTAITGQMQAEATSMIFKNLMGTMKEMMDQKREGGGEKEKSTMQQVLEVAGPIVAALAQPKPAEPNSVVPGNEPMQPHPAATTTPEVEPPQRVVRRPKIAPPAQAAPAATPASAPTTGKQKAARGDNPTKYSDTERIQYVVEAIHNLSVGKIPPDQRFQMLQWAARWAPANLLAAIGSGKRDEVIAVGGPAIMAVPHLIEWISEERNLDFLTSAVADLKAMLDGTITRERMENAIIDTAEFQKRDGPQRSKPRRTQAVEAEIIHDAPTQKPAAEASAEAPSVPAVPPAADHAAAPATAAAAEAPAASAPATDAAPASEAPPVKKRRIPKPTPPAKG